jgi:hypothetical protein
MKLNSASFHPFPVYVFVRYLAEFISMVAKVGDDVGIPGTMTLSERIIF